MTKIKTYPTPRTLNSPSYFPHIKQKVCTIISWAELYELIHGPELKEITLNIRSLRQQGLEKTYRDAKSQLSAFTPAIVCQGGHAADANGKQLTGVSMVDLDHIPADRMADIVEKVTNDPHTMLCYTTVSGLGMHIFYRYTADSPEVAYCNVWKTGNEYYEMLCSHPADPTTKNVNRLSFVNHDPNCYYNPQAVAFFVEEEQKGKQDEEELMALAERWVERGGLTYTMGSRHNFLVSLCFLMLKLGVSESAAIALLERKYGDLDEDKGMLVRSIYKHSELAGTLVDKGATAAARGKAKGEKKELTVNQVVDYLRGRKDLRYNSIRNQVEIEDGGSWHTTSDDDLNQVWRQCCVAIQKDIAPTTFFATLRSKVLPPFDPFESYFAALPAWDGKDRIKELAQRVTVKNHSPLAGQQLETTTKHLSSQEIFVSYFKKWFVGVVASVINKEVTNHTVLIFIGQQGIYKSTFFRMLLPPELRDYFLVKTNSVRMSKDDRLALSDNMLICFEEIDSMDSRELNQIKGLITTTSISERRAYDRVATQCPHRASFCGTGNNLQFLGDLTGNRRWLVFEVTNISNPYDNPLEYGQLYAQAHQLYSEGFSFYFSKEEVEALTPHQEDFREVCMEEELLLTRFDKPSEHHLGEPKYASEIFSILSANCRSNLLTVKRLSQVLKNLDYPRKRTGKGVVYYVVDKLIL